jgi:DNA polymerase delta subunit 1
MVASQRKNSRESILQHVLSVTIIERQSLLGYHGKEGKRQFLKIHVAMPTLVPRARRVLEQGFTCPGYGSLQYQTYESNGKFFDQNK